MNRLSDDYYKRAVFRVEILRVIFERGGYSDTVREAQEAVELFLKGLLRKVGVDPPRWHDVSKALVEYENLFSLETRANLPRPRARGGVLT